MRLYFIIIYLCVCSGFDLYAPKLGIDYGPRLIGLALGNKLGQVNPFTTITNHHNITEICYEISDLVISKGIIDVILGIPLDSNGKLSYKVRNFNGGLCLDFSKVLATVIKNECPDAKVHLVDERFSTREAKARMKADKIKASLDAVSAACLIERFNEDEGDYSILAEPCGWPIPPELEILDYSRVSDYIKETYSQELTPQQVAKRRMEALKVYTITSYT